MNPRGLDLKLPSLRGEIDRWKCRSGPPLSFPSKRFKNHGRNGEEGQGSKLNNGGERETEVAAQPSSQLGKKGGIYTPPPKRAVADSLTPESPV